MAGATRFSEPPMRIGRNGLPETTFEALPDVSEGPGRMSYEGSIPGPTLRVQRGDWLETVEQLSMEAEEVANVAGQLYVLQSAAGALTEMNPATPNGVYAVEADGTLSLLADLTTWILATPTTLTSELANELGELYCMQAGDNGLWVLEANRGELLWVALDGQMTRIVDLSATHPVWTALAVAPDGNLLAGMLTPVPDTDGSASFEEVLTGLEYANPLELGPDGAHYVVLRAYGPSADAGAIIRVDLDHERPMVFDSTLLAGARCPGAETCTPPQPDDAPGMLADDHDHAATPAAVRGDRNAATAQAVSISNFAYDPTPLRIGVGTTVTGTNNDPLLHTATAGDDSFDTGNIGAGATVSLTVTTAGSFAYSCL